MIMSKLGAHWLKRCPMCSKICLLGAIESKPAKMARLRLEAQLSAHFKYKKTIKKKDFCPPLKLGEHPKQKHGKVL